MYNNLNICIFAHIIYIIKKNLYKKQIVMKHLLMILFAALVTFTYGCNSEDGIKVISATEFAEAVKNDSTAVIVDVRTAGEYAGGHIKGALNLDVKDAEAFDNGVKTFCKDNNYYVYCRSGRRSHNAALKIQKAGFNVVDMEGGINAWKDAKMPVEVSAASAR